MFSLLDYFSGYHQVWLCKEDETKTSFITPCGTYCYKRMPEGLKNTRSTFSWMIAIIVGSQIGRNILTYVNDIVVKRKIAEDHIVDLRLLQISEDTTTSSTPKSAPSA
jgi:hypothetical protein